MVWIYGGLFIILLAPIVFFRNYKKAFFRSLNRKEHPLRKLYPGMAKLRDTFLSHSGKRQNRHMDHLLRSLYIKDNIQKEKELYQIQKNASVLAVVLGMLLLGFLASLSEYKDPDIKTLQRAQYGQGSRTYELEVDYRDIRDTITLNVEETHYTRSEILELFDRSCEEVRKIMLGDNESAEEVREQLQFIPEYNGIHIFWEIDDPESMDYNGNIKVRLPESKTQLVNLFATFSLDDVSEVYTFPVRLTGDNPDQTGKLFQDIKNAVEEKNSVYQQEVMLPEEINGYRITFRKILERKGYIFLILTAAAVICLVLFYDRNLEMKVRKRQEQMMMDYTRIVSKLNLLYHAGLSIHGAFERIVEDYEEKRLRESEKKGLLRKRNNSGNTERYAYREMKLTLAKIHSGVSETEAYAQFGKRCALPAYIKLGTILEQNLNKGTKGMQDLLRKEVEDSCEERRRLARKKGEEASTKMLGPMVLMLLVVIAIIAFPALMSMNL